MNLKKISLGLRLVNSLYWRLILLVLLVMTVAFSSINYFEWYHYLIFLSVYLVAFFLHLFFDDNYKGIIRLFFDLSLIILFIYGKELNSPLNFLPFFLIMINSLNFSGEKNRYTLFFILLNISLFIANRFTFNWVLHFSIFSLALIMLSYYIRFSVYEFNNEVTSEVGSLFFEGINKNDEHKILSNVKERINVRGGLTKIEDIFLFVRRGDKLILIKGTEFVMSNPEFSDVVREKVFENEGAFDKIATNLIVKEKSINDAYWLKCIISNIEYYFMISVKNIDFTYGNILILNSYIPIFNQIAGVFQISLVLKKLKKEEIDIIKKKITYVLDSQNALHYVKNKLSPITLKLSLVDIFFNKKEEFNEEKIEMIEQELSNVDPQEMRAVLDKAELLIKGIDNLLQREDQIVKLRKLIGLVKDAWVYHFSNWDDINIMIDGISNYNIKVNIELFEYVFSDLIENIYKYSMDFKALNIYMTDLKDKVVFQFENDVDEFEKNEEKLKEISRLYNETSNDEIYNRRTHGLSFVRRLTRRKDINSDVIIDSENQKYIFNIYIKT